MTLPLWLRIIAAAILISAITVPPLAFGIGIYHMGYLAGRSAP